jgi:hypothetical protein
MNESTSPNGIPAKMDWGAPAYLYRAFSEEKYACEFMEEGKFRARHIMSYVKTENPNIADENEGRALWETATGGGGAAISPFPVYILCLAGPEVDLSHLRNRYGKYIVQINDPKRFVEDLAGSSALPASIHCVKVKYTDKHKLEQQPERDEKIRLTYSQKELRFARDCEYRIAVIASETGGGCLGYSFNFQKRLEYVELLDQ